VTCDKRIRRERARDKMGVMDSSSYFDLFRSSTRSRVQLCRVHVRALTTQRRAVQSVAGMRSQIASLHAREILDSRGSPAITVTVILADGT